MKKTLSLSFLILFCASTISAQDYNLTDFERRMFNIYKTSYNQEVTDQEWLTYVANLSERNYIISGGDTLWDLSTIFFGDGNYWPKVWSYNATLTNPHMLKIGNRIRFFTGSPDEAPGAFVDAEPDFEEEDVVDESVPSGFKVVKTGKDEKAIVRDDLQTQTVKKMQAELEVQRSLLYPGAPKIPPPTDPTKPVMKQIPNSFEDSFGYNANQYNEKGISFDVRPPVRVNPLYVAHSFLYGGKAEDYPKVGLLIESEDNNLLVGQSSLVYIRSAENLEIGERLTVMGRDYRFDRNGYDGDVIRYMGTVEISEILENQIFRGVLLRSLSGVRGVPWVSREPIPAFADDFAGRPSNIKFQVIGGGGDNSSRIYGQSDVIYLNGGANAGLRVGDILGIYKRRDIRYRDAEIDRAPTPIGHIKVYRAERNLASAFVIESTEVIIPGDETGAPTRVEAKTTASERKDLNDIEEGLDFDSNVKSPPVESSSAEDIQDSDFDVQ